MGRTRHRAAYLFLAPFLVLFLGFFVLPVIYAFGMSLYISRGLASIFVGFQNYELAFQDADFWSSIERMIYFGVVQVTLMLLLALVFALILDSPLGHARTLYRLLYFLPYAVPGVVSAIIWSYLYGPYTGPLQGILNRIGIHVSLLASNIILYSIMNIVTWAWTGYNMTIIAAGLTNISPDLYEAARIDGAGEFWIAVRIKIPLVRPLLVLIAVLSIIGTLQLFNEPYILATLTPIPASFTPNLDVYQTAFSFGSFNYSATLAIILSVITIAASYLFLFLTGRGHEEAL